MQVRAGRRLSDRKRNRIIDAGRTVFLKKGFGAAGMDAIAARANVSKMTVYRHFRSKELLFAGVISELCRRIVDDDLEGLLALAPREALRSFADGVVAIIFARETVELHRIVVAESRRFPELGRLFYRSGPQACIDMLEQYLQRHRPCTWNHDDARRHAEEFLDLIRGYPHLRLLLGIDKRPSQRELAARIDSAIGRLLAAMEANSKRDRRNSSRPTARRQAVPSS
jgi:TetR/AcrR family transcriptional regulator, mexJK operon transcriptional repressor